MNLVAAVLYLAFAAVHVRSFAEALRPSLLVVVIIETLVAVLFLLRAPAERTTRSSSAWVTTLGGTLAPLLLRPVAGGHDVLVGQIVQCGGGAFALVALAFLNRSFGLLPAVRPIQLGGPYRWLRHPIYAGYSVQNLGYLASNATAWNLAVVVVALGFQVLRVHEEERLLCSVPEYAAYRQQTRWRLLPLVF